jgi:hypothetical protein
MHNYDITIPKHPMGARSVEKYSTFDSCKAQADKLFANKVAVAWSTLSKAKKLM